MIEKFGIGIDIVKISRFEKIKFSEKPTFYTKLFLESEIKYCLKYKNSSEHFAGKFAIKEATKKSIKEQLSFLDIEILNSNLKPTVKLLNKKLNYIFLASLSHEKEFAVGVVLSQQIE